MDSVGALENDSNPLFKVLQIQCSIALIAMVPLFFVKVGVALAIFLAMAVVAIPGLYTLAISSLPMEKQATGIAKVLKAELGKYAITVMLFILIFSVVENLEVVVFFVSVLALHMSALLVPVVLRLRKS